MQSWFNINLQLFISQMSNCPNTLRLYSLTCITSCFILLISKASTLVLWTWFTATWLSLSCVIDLVSLRKFCRQRRVLKLHSAVALEAGNTTRNLNKRSTAFSKFRTSCDFPANSANVSEITAVVMSLFFFQVVFRNIFNEQKWSA